VLRRKSSEDIAQTPEPVKGRYLFLNRNVWEDAVGIMQVDQDADEDEDEEKEEDEEEEDGLEAESEGEPQAPPDGGAIVLDDLSLNT